MIFVGQNLKMIIWKPSQIWDYSGDVYYGEKLQTKEGLFTKLKDAIAQPLWFELLNSLVIEEGALYNLQQFVFGLSLTIIELPMDRSWYFKNIFILQNVPDKFNSLGSGDFDQKRSFLILKLVTDFHKYMGC